MKYPQLVSSRAVNEISDWLIKRLEDLDIEQPSVYSRLLLSLLHTPFKVNAIDLLEIPQLKDLKQPYHLLNKNNEELKRLAAVESLMEVSAEENKSHIISLVDELHSKLRKVESSCDENTIINRTSNVAIASTSPVTSSSSKFYKNLKKIKRNHGGENPTKNYYLAFPALSSNKKTSTTTITSGGSKRSTPSEVTDSNLLCWSNLMSSGKEENSQQPPTTTTTSDAEKLLNAVKMKAPRRKRRYGRVVNKPKQIDVQCNGQSYDVAQFSPKAKSGSKKHQRNQMVNLKNASSGKVCSGARGKDLRMDFPPSSSQIWDMDFQGQWEMDRDLIGEFIQQQQQRQRHHHQQQLIDARPIEAKSANQVEQAMDEEDDVMLMKFLPKKLMDDDSAVNDLMSKEAQTLNSFKSKFDANVKALWNNVDDPLTKPLTYKSFDDDGNASLVSSFASEKNSLGLFNFNGHQPHTATTTTMMEVIAPCSNPQLYSNRTHFMSIADFEGTNGGGRGGGGYQSQHSLIIPSVSPRTERFIKSGTNLQTSIWSEGEFASESLVYKDVVDHRDDGIYKGMNSIGDEMKHWQQKSNVQEDENRNETSLFNHSERSAFKRFRPPIITNVSHASYHPYNGERKRDYASSEPDNLLTSLKTHFSPIMRDGHMFTIDRNWEKIKWERSASGSFVYNNKRYMEYTALREANDKTKNGHSMNNIDLVAIEKDAKKEDFFVRFVIKDENNKSCQTDINDLLRINNRVNLMEINEEYCKRKIYDEYFKGITENSSSNNNNNKWRYQLTADDSNDYSFFSVNRVKTNAGGSAPKPFPNIMASSNSSSSSICTITSSSYDTSAVDPFESWRSIKIDNGGMLDSDYKQACMHSLWEQCTTCMARNDYDPYYEEKSIPANRLMKDELRMDGDEIMSVIQNLYITGDYCDDEEEKDEDDFEDMNHLYMDMLDDSMDGEEESKFYEAEGGKGEEKVKGKKQQFTPDLLYDPHQREELLQLESFDEITLAKMQWQWDKNREPEKDQEKYLKLLKWIQASLLKEDNPDTNNNCSMLNDDRRPKNRKRRHSTCQNFMENKSSRSQDNEFTYHLNLSHSPSAIIEDNIFVDAAKMLKVNIEKILLVADPDNASVVEHCKDENGPNYYRNILQQQHALIKQMDLARPLTR